MDEPKQRPRGLSATTLVMLGFFIQSYLAPVPSIPPNVSFTFYISVRLISLVISVVVIWSYWRGQNWARRLVLAYSVFTVWYLVSWDYSYLTRWEIPRLNYWRITNTLTVCFSAFMLYWLNNPRTKAFFERRETERPRNRFQNVLQQIGIWGTSVSLLLVGIFLGATYSFIRIGLSNVGLLTLYTVGPLILSCCVVNFYYKLKEDQKTRRRVVFFVAAWTFALGLLLIKIGRAHV